MTVICVECPSTSIQPRPATYPGPRCHTHHYAWIKANTVRARLTYVERQYGVSAERYEAVYRAQGGRCFICRRKARSRQLAMDHDHACCPGPVSCGKCFRGLLCSPCNRFLGHIRDDPMALQRGIEHLLYPIGQRT